MTGLSRNGHLIKSVSYGVVAKFFGGGVAIFGLPLISYKSSPLDYQFFLVLMSLASFFSMPMGVLNYSIISRLSVYYASRDMDRIDEEVSGFWALTVFCSVFLFFLFLLIYPFLDVPFFAFFSVIMITMLHNFTRFFEAVNVAYKMDFYNSIGYLFSSAVMLAVYVFFDHIFLHDLVVSYFFVPLFFSLIPAFFCLVRPEIFFKFCSLKDSFFLVLKSADHFYIQLVEFFKVYLIPLVYVLVLGLGDEQYALILTLILFAARLVNPVSLVARPLFPAFADAVSQSDYEWIKKFVTIFMSVFSIASLFFPFLFVFYGRDFLNIVFPNYADQFRFISILPSLFILLVSLLLIFFCHFIIQ